MNYSDDWQADWTLTMLKSGECKKLKDQKQEISPSKHLAEHSKQKKKNSTSGR